MSFLFVLSFVLLVIWTLRFVWMGAFNLLGLDQKIWMLRKIGDVEIWFSSNFLPIIGVPFARWFSRQIEKWSWYSEWEIGILNGLILTTYVLAHHQGYPVPWPF